MSKVGRNDPCPCGSGRKYKQCCLKKERITQHKAADASSDGAVMRALDWLNRKHQHAVKRWIDEVWLGDLSAAEYEEIQKTEPEMQQMLKSNMFDCLLADGRLRHNGKEQFVMDIVLGVGGALMTSGQRQYLQQLRDRPLRLYEIREVHAGEGVLLHDLMNEDIADVWVRERSGSQYADQWGMWAARIIDCGDHLELSGAIFDIPRDSLEKVVATLKRMRSDNLIEHKDEMYALAIANYWLKLLATPLPMPNIIDAATGEAIMFITEHYRVNDWAALTARLASESDVEGDKMQGWNRMQPLKNETVRSLVAINISDKKDRLELFTRSITAADTQKAWFTCVAADAVSHLTREISDPMALMQNRDKTPPRADSDTPEAAQQLIHDYKQKYYANWVDEPLPALNGNTARQAVKTDDGRRAVVALLKDFENREGRQKMPFDFCFLWEMLGLDRKE
ncbi:MAG: SEC-C metal-binding domain-containing protein [Mariprofundaceae bacterium]|nr:SEC-C metal-binding domain-containing protein [Mariprofundaceae bacterium]